MAKKLSLLLAAVAVLAFAIPSMASASALTSGGKLVATGTAITGTGSTVVLQSSTLGKIECASLVLKGTVTKNDGTTVEGSGNTENPKTENCKNGANTVVVTGVNLTNLASTGTTHTGTASFTAKVDVGAELVCSFVGTKVPFTYTSGGSSIVFKEGAGVSGGACGTAKLSGSFLLESAAGSLVLD
jgi:hypothetical protein